MNTRQPAVRVAVLLGALAAGGCGRHEPPPPPATEQTRAPPARTATAHSAAPAAVAHGAATPGTSPVPAAAASTAPADDRFRIASVALGDAVDAAHAVLRPKDRFAPAQPSIYASVATRGRTAGVVLGARWRYLEGAGQTIGAIDQAIATDGAAVTAFQLRNPQPWPTGRYRVEILLDGRVAASRDFEVGP